LCTSVVFSWLVELEPRRGEMSERSESTDSGGAHYGGGEDEEGVLTLVCVTCGTEYYFSDVGQPDRPTCEKCGGEVFRSFHSPAEGDEAAMDHQESTRRDLDPDDAEGEAMPGDVLDLNPG